MTQPNTHPEPTSPDTLDQACDMFLEWDRSVYGTMNVAEGMILSDLLASLGRPDVAEHIARSVWKAEDETEADPLPWANGHGSRKTEQAVTFEDRYERMGMEQFHFTPRPNPFDLPDVVEFWAAQGEEGAA
ncbi:hypothetical protein ITJ57_19130 [Plantibacter sp. VKM Ac-2880]|uniref:hypothetical protein n=1 Tax=Plantibacter sp. VKM Ac-2880 TaxID=2783827 RepID=UPI00188FB134|nr:hypothetical protein [Plantibacter sp. VKM Ac-2880]MBF4570886.1 hypothetical protein [Plantibacter sp. VKM Ac-2880]